MRAAALLTAVLAASAFIGPDEGRASGPGEEASSSKIIVVYGEALAGAEEPKPIPLLLDLYLPSLGEGLRPAIIALHGGSFRTGSRDIEEQVEYGEAFSERGYVVLSVGYRQQGDAPHVQPAFQRFAEAVRAADYPPVEQANEAFGDGFAVAAAAAAEDSMRALAWLREHAAALQVDPERIVLLGASAGAITAINMAYLNDEYGIERPPVAAVVEVRGMAVDDRSPRGRSVFRQGDPPLFIIHGTNDDRLSFTEAVRLYGQAREAGIPVEFHPFVGFGHELGGDGALALRLDSGELLIDRIDRFLKEAFVGRLDPSYALCIGAGAACP